jgi:sodium/potassium-transporting ATPase subunit alpha
MKRKPRDPKKDRLITMKMAIYSYIWLGTIQAIAGYLAFYVTMADYGLTPNELDWSSFSSFTFFRHKAPDLEYEPGKFYDAEKQLEILAEAQTAFFVAVVVTRIGCVLASKTRKLSLFKHGFLG